MVRPDSLGSRLFLKILGLCRYQHLTDSVNGIFLGFCGWGMAVAGCGWGHVPAGAKDSPPVPGGHVPAGTKDPSPVPVVAGSVRIALYTARKNG